MKILRHFLTFALLLSGVQAADTPTPITGLPAISSVSGTTILPVVDMSGTPTTKKATVAQLIDGLPVATGSTIGIMSASDKAKLNAATAAATAGALIIRDGSGNASVNSLNASAVTGLGSPVNGTDAANKSYVDAAAAGLVIKSPARVGTVGANITLAGGAPSTLDGVSLTVNDRVLVKDQTDGKENGIYYVATLGSGSNGTWTRTTDADTGAELVTGSYVFITSGTVNANAAYTMVTTGTITIGTSFITWNLFSQVTQIQAANILGQIVAAQVQDGAINTAKFALGLTPVEILSTLPGSGNFTGRQVFLTTDGKLYRYSGGSFTASVPAVDLTGQITVTQIADNSISTPKLQALSVVAGKIATNAVTAGTIAANAVTAGTISAGAVNTAELAAGAVNASKIAANTITAGQIAANTITAGQIQAGSITADRLTISSLSAISANIGTITSGSLTSSASVTVGSGLGAVSISSAGLNIGSGRISAAGDGSNPWIRVFGTGGFASSYVELNGSNGGTRPRLAFFTGAGSPVTLTESTIYAGNGVVVTVDNGGVINGPGDLNVFGGSGSALSMVVGEDGSAGSQQGYLVIQVNGRAVKVPFYNL